MPNVSNPCESLSGSSLDTDPGDPEEGLGNAALHSAVPFDTSSHISGSQMAAHVREDRSHRADW